MISMSVSALIFNCLSGLEKRPQLLYRCFYHNTRLFTEPKSSIVIIFERSDSIIPSIFIVASMSSS